MAATTSPDWNTVGILGAARGARSGAGDPVGSEHLLAGITSAKGAAREALGAEGATKVVLLAVLRDRLDRDGAWSSDDDAEHVVTEQDVLGAEGERRTRYTGAAARALTAAMEQARREDAKKFGAAHLLRGLLEGDNRAVEALGACGIAPGAVLARLDDGTGRTSTTGGPGGPGGPGTANTPGAPGAPGHIQSISGTDPADSRTDDLDPLLHATRDVLLGHDHYRRAPFWMRWLLKLGGVNWASRPAFWVRMETYEQARRLGGGTAGTEHVLLAVLATHEVALRYPHLAGRNSPGPGSPHAGGERLARLGVDYVSAHRALTTGRLRLTPDARPVEQYLGRAGGPDPTRTPGSGAAARSGGEPAADPGTGPLVEALLAEGTRARQLVDALSSPPGD
ncbi:Clp protease N-terminal domain-containing protein [Streptomyces sp. NPDC088557]|uniref:Clp protease N-terminal domain-containing protein n=1 Tax=Streptomyces sp. NPDC088557 TaxID=3365867 RepID=UPI003815A781